MGSRRRRHRFISAGAFDVTLILKVLLLCARLILNQNSYNSESADERSSTFLSLIRIFFFIPGAQIKKQ
jgi:hypothetical protein